MPWSAFGADSNRRITWELCVNLAFASLCNVSRKRKKKERKAKHAPTWVEPAAAAAVAPDSSSLSSTWGISKKNHYWSGGLVHNAFGPSLQPLCQFLWLTWGTYIIMQEQKKQTNKPCPLLLVCRCSSRFDTWQTIRPCSRPQNVLFLQRNINEYGFNFKVWMG